MQRRCKFQQNCRDFKQGNCKFSHDTVSSTGGMGGNQPSRNPNPNYSKPQGGMGGQQKQCQKGQNCYHWKIGKCNFYHPQPYQQNTGGNMVQQQPMHQNIQQNTQQNMQQNMNQHMNQPMHQNMSQNMSMNQNMNQNINQNMNQNQNNKQSGICQYGAGCRRFKEGKCRLDHSGPTRTNGNQYCQFWQKGNCIKTNCHRHHGFSMGGQVERVYHTSEFPKHVKSGIGLMTMENNHYLFPRAANTVFSLLYPAGEQNLQTQPFQIEAEDIIYKSKVNGNWILLAYEKSKLQNIQLFNVQTSQTFIIEKAHQRPITGLAMFADNLLLSSSLDGQNPIKMWQLEGDKFVINPENTKMMSTQINNPKVEINFIKIIVIGGSKCLCAGTNDGRVLIWKDGQFMAIQMTGSAEPYTAVFDFDIQVLSEHPCGFILAWTGDKQTSGIFVVNMSNPSNVVPFHTENTQMTHLIVTPTWMVTANLGNQVNFYKIELSAEGPKSNKVGSAAFNNVISDMLYMEATTSTLINVKEVLVLESFRESPNQNQANSGSLSIFRIE